MAPLTGSNRPVGLRMRGFCEHLLGDFAEYPAPLAPLQLQPNRCRSSTHLHNRSWPPARAPCITACRWVQVGAGHHCTCTRLFPSQLYRWCRCFYYLELKYRLMAAENLIEHRRWTGIPPEYSSSPRGPATAKNRAGVVRVLCADPDRYVSPCADGGGGARAHCGPGDTDGGRDREAAAGLERDL